MLNPRSRAGRLASSVFGRRPSAAMVVALLALFLAAGGASYAATALPSNSVGTDQLQNNAVTNHKIRDNAVGNHKIQNNAVGFRKIQAGAIGAQRVNKGAVQLRVGGTCTAGGQAITAIQNTGKVTCGATTPASFNGGQSDPVTITSSSAASATQITGISLAAGSSYVVMANPQISVSAADQAFGHVVVSCTLSVAGAATATQTRTQSFDLGFGQTTPSQQRGAASDADAVRRAAADRVGGLEHVGRGGHRHLQPHAHRHPARHADGDRRRHHHRAADVLELDAAEHREHPVGAAGADEPAADDGRDVLTRRGGRAVEGWRWRPTWSPPPGPQGEHRAARPPRICQGG